MSKNFIFFVILAIQSLIGMHRSNSENDMFIFNDYLSDSDQTSYVYFFHRDDDFDLSERSKRFMKGYIDFIMQIFCESKHPKKIYQLCKKEILKSITLTKLSIIDPIWDSPIINRPTKNDDLNDIKKLLFWLYCYKDFSPSPYITLTMYTYEPDDIDELIKVTESILMIK